MKKIIILSVMALVSLASLYSWPYKITNVNYDLSTSSGKKIGATSSYALERNVSIDKEKLFESEKDLNFYLSDYKQKLANLRAFDSIDVSYDLLEEGISINVKCVDSFHILGVPYLTYNSNSGFKPKIKVKDSDFLGTLNPLTADIYAQFPIASDDNDLYLGTNVSFDYPFQLGKFNATWVNDISTEYKFGENTPEWNIKTGLDLELPINKIISFQWNFYQSSIRELDYRAYGDSTYFVEYAKFATPICLKEIDYFGKVYYTPYISLTYNWDFDGIKFDELKGPTLTPGHSISFGRNDWSENLRNGFHLSFDNSYTYNFYNNSLDPYFEIFVKAYKKFTIYDGNWLSRFGLAARAKVFNHMEVLNNNDYRYGEKIGSELRGIRDNQFFGNSYGTEYSASTGLYANIDFPFHIVTTNFQNGFLRYLNMDIQLSPFFDFALTKNDRTNKAFDIRDGFYAGGLEVLVYPAKWSNYVIRASVGIDLGRTVLKKIAKPAGRDTDVSKYEISFGLGLMF